jgi:hypothetical protein
MTNAMENHDNSKPVPPWVYAVIVLAIIGLTTSVVWGALIRMGKLPY